MKVNKKNKKIVGIIVVIIVVVAIGGIAFLSLSKKGNNTGNDIDKKVNEKNNEKTEENNEKNTERKTVDIGKNTIYYYTRLKHNNENVVSFDTYANLEDTWSAFSENYDYKNKNISRISSVDNEYGESNNEYKVTYDEQGNRNVDREVGYYQYAIKNDKVQSIVYVDVEAENAKEVLVKIKYDDKGKVTHIYTNNDLDKELNKIIEYKYDKEDRVSSMIITHPKKTTTENEDNLHNSEYDNLTVDFQYEDGMAIANVYRDGIEETALYVYYYNADGWLDYVQMCTIDDTNCQWLGDIHEFPGKELWNCTLDYSVNPIIKLP